MSAIISYKDLTVWQKSVELVVEVYRLTKLYPKEELYGLVSQTRRGAISIPANIAEGYARKHRQEYIQFIRIAFASGAELETLLFLAEKLGFVTDIDVAKPKDLLDSVMKMLNRLINALVAKS